jgi:hypothetical protein
VPQAEKTGFMGGMCSGQCRKWNSNKSAKGTTIAAGARWSLSQVSLNVVVISGKHESQSFRAGFEKQPQI